MSAASDQHRVVVRYGECDAQGVVFNAHYLAYCDDAMDWWLRSTLDSSWKRFGWEFVLKRVELTWEAPARAGDVIDLASSVHRWGTTSFEVAMTGRVGDEEIFTAVLTYVGVATGTRTPISMPESIRHALSGSHRAQ